MSGQVPTDGREGSLEAPTRHPIDWRSPSYYDSAALQAELERVFDICQGCRRCFSLCQSFPTLFDAVDASDGGELATVPRAVYWQVVDHCYQCDLCFMTKCPYVPPHPWAVDFPKLMLRAKAQRSARTRPSLRDRLLASTEAVGNIAGIPVVAELVNALNRSTLGRVVLEKTLGVHRDAPLPPYRSRTARSKLTRRSRPVLTARPTPRTTGRVVLFTTCYGNRNEPELATDLAAVFEHNGISVDLAARERCCGMPRLELGDLKTVEAYKQVNVPELTRLTQLGFDIVAPIPSCVLMFKQELPLLFPEDAEVQQLKGRVFDPFEYLMLRHEAGLLRTDFARSLGRVSYHVPCHLRVQNIGLKTRDLLRLIPQTVVQVIERCSGHDGTYGVKREFRAASVRIGKPVVQQIARDAPDFYASDCPMAAHQLQTGLASLGPPVHPLALLRRAYGI